MSIKHDTKEFVLQTLSPVHIGCGEVYEPTNSFIHAPSKKLMVFDPMDLVASLNAEQRKKFMAIADESTNPFKRLFEFYRTEKMQLKGRTVRLARDIPEHFQEMMGRNKKSEFNRFLMERSAFYSDTGKLYIPGSGLKGAIRTGVLNSLAGELPGWVPEGRNPRERAGKLEEYLLGGKFATDPFRLWKPGDFGRSAKAKGKIFYCHNIKKRPRTGEKSKAMYQLLECLLPDTHLEGEITIQYGSDLQTNITNYKGQVEYGGIKRSGELKTENGGKQMFMAFLSRAHEFYEQLLNQEDGWLRANHLESQAANSYRREKEKLEGEGKKAWLLRLGRHSGLEGMTIEKYRARRGNRVKEATTFWVACDDGKNVERSSQTLGWVLLREK